MLYQFLLYRKMNQCTYLYLYQYWYISLHFWIPFPFRSVQFSLSVMSNSLWPQGLQHTRLPCPSPSPGTCSNSCLLNQWYHQTIWSSVIPFPSCLQSFPASGSFLMSQVLASGGQSIRASASASVLPMNIPFLPTPRKNFKMYFKNFVTLRFYENKFVLLVVI